MISAEAFMTEQTINPELLAKKQGLIVGYGIGAHVAAMIYLGIELDLYAALREGGAASPLELAARTGLHERWLREWLQQQAASGVIEYDRATQRFAISPEVWMLLGDVDELRTLRTNFTGLTYRFGMLDRLPQAFQTGIGVSWDDRGERGPESTEQLFRNWYRQVLVPEALPKLTGVVEKLRTGGAAADVGCGTGLAMIEMAQAFPDARFHGYETSKRAIERGREHVQRAGVSNVMFHDANDDMLPPEPTYDFITTFDCLHDMTHPHEAAAAIRAAIKPDGIWFIADINGARDFEENLATRPLSSLLYAISVMSCMSSALSEEGGAGYGTLGLPEPRMRELAQRAGFTRFRRVEELVHPVNAYYEARP
jgi:2-polyprenyl-3-methyl-5-hydroxy-6-metoxy-1,4-benzoquinol methylase